MDEIGILGFQPEDKQRLTTNYNIESPVQTVWLGAMINELRATALQFRHQMRQAEEIETASPDKAMSIRRDTAESIIRQFERAEDVLSDKDTDLARDIMTRLGMYADDASEALNSNDPDRLRSLLGGQFTGDSVEIDSRTFLDKYIAVLEKYLREIS